MNRHDRRAKGKTIIGHARVFDMVQYITGPLEVESMNDLSQEMQDQIMAALERRSDEIGTPLVVKGVRCDHDPDLPDDHPHKFYLHVVASEIVAVVAKQRETRH